MAPRNENRRREILASTYRLLDDSSYDKISLSDISREAKINKSLLQRYYPQKIDIIKEMLLTLLETSYGFIEKVPLNDEDIFQRISNYNMLFFAGVAEDYRFYQFILATVSSAEILDVWIDTICSWLRRSVHGKDFNMLDLRRAMCFSMGGTMHLFQHQEELGIDYRFFCEKHIRTILGFLQYPFSRIDEICLNTNNWLSSADVERYLSYCKDNIDWIDA